MKIGQTPEIQSAALQAIASKQAKPSTPTAENTANVSATAKGVASAAASGVPVTLSRTAREIEPSGRAQGDFDAGRVQAVRSAIENGTFKVDAGAIADKMLANAEEVISRLRG